MELGSELEQVMELGSVSEQEPVFRIQDCR